MSPDLKQMTVALVQITYEIHTFAFDSDDGIIMDNVDDDGDDL